MKTRYGNSPAETAQMDTDSLRENFLIENLFLDNQISLTYSLYDRMIIGGAKPVDSSVVLPTYSELKSDYFLERREAGILNIGGNGTVNVDGIDYNLAKLDCLYIGKGSKEVVFSSDSPENPALFYLLSCPAHMTYPTQLMKADDASPTEMGSQETANKRTINKYIYLDGIRSCQLVLGLTKLAPGSVWNTMPTHVHDRRMEAYLYFDLPENQKVIHLMGQPTETRHLVISNQEAIISPPWSIHSGCGTSNYSFIWGMAGENQVYSDMDAVNINDLR
ncbi:MAG: 5-dehydro-4-deoxy-D-glucuronate isomerase [Bacteroidota bacterium]